MTYERSRSEILLLNLTTLLYLFRSALPVLKYPFIVLFTCFIFYFIIAYRGRLKEVISFFIREYYISLALAIILGISFFLSDKYYLIIFKDLGNTAVLLSIFLIASALIRSKTDLNYYVRNLIVLILLFSSIISVVKLLFYFDILTASDFYYNNSMTERPELEALKADYSIGLLPSFFGIFCALFAMTTMKKTITKVIPALLTVMFSFQIFLSGSRRGVIILILILLMLLAGYFISGKLKNLFLRSLLKTSGIYLIVLFFFSFSVYLLITLTSYETKNSILDFLGSKSITATKYKISKNILRYTSVISKSTSYAKVDKSIWSTEFVPEDPDSGWGTRVHKTVFPLPGENAGIVPDNAKGYLMDSTCNASYYAESNTSESYTLVTKLESRKGDKFRASVFCFVSEDFDGGPVLISVGADYINNEIVKGHFTSNYNLENRGIWQKLELEFETTGTADIPVFLSFFKTGASDFRKLRGYVIYAYPQFNIIYRAPAQPSLYSKAQIPFLIPGQLIKMFYKQDLDKDPFRRFISELVSEDTAYHPYKASITIRQYKSPFIEDRAARWEFAIKIFIKEYSPAEKIFGSGFDFLNWFGHFFLRDNKKIDYPHNPFLFILLYSGILGLIIYGVFLYKQIVYLFRYSAEYPLILIFYIITFFFSFFSSGSPFDPPLMGFFSLLPFLIHSVHKGSMKES